MCHYKILLNFPYTFPSNYKKDFLFCGAKKAILNLALGFRKINSDVYVLGHGLTEKDSYSFNIEKNMGVHYYNLPIGIKGKNKRIRILKNLIKTKFDIAIFSMPDLFELNIIRKFSNKIVWISFGSTRMFIIHDVIKKMRLKDFFNIQKVIYLFKLLTSDFERIHVMKKSNILIGLTHKEVEVLKSETNRNNNIFLIPLWVDTERYKPRTINKDDIFYALKKFMPFPKKVDLLNYKMIIVTTGRLSPENNIHLALQLAKEKKDFLFIIGGNSLTHEKEYINTIFKYAQKMNNVILFFNIPEEHFPYIYNLGDVFIQLTTDYSPLPNVILEALSSGLPVISTPIVDRKIAVINRKNGFFIDTICPNKIIKKTITVLDTMSNDYQLDILRENARNHAIKFDIKETAQKMLNFIQN